MRISFNESIGFTIKNKIQTSHFVASLSYNESAIIGYIIIKAIVIIKLEMTVNGIKISFGNINPNVKYNINVDVVNVIRNIKTNIRIETNSE